MWGVLGRVSGVSYSSACTGISSVPKSSTGGSAASPVALSRPGIGSIPKAVLRVLWPGSVP